MLNKGVNMPICLTSVAIHMWKTVTDIPAVFEGLCMACRVGSADKGNIDVPICVSPLFLGLGNYRRGKGWCIYLFCCHVSGCSCVRVLIKVLKDMKFFSPTLSSSY